MAASLFGSADNGDFFNQRLSQMLTQNALDTSPVQSPTQGLARMANALLAGMDMRRKEAQGRDTAAALANLLGGGQQPVAASNQPISAPMGALPSMNSPSVDSVYSDPSKFNPMDAAVATPQELSAGVPDSVPDQYKPLLGKAAVDNAIPVDVLARQLKQESNFNPNAVSPVGAQGISQFMPATAKEMGINPLDPNQAIPAGASYLRQNIDKFGGSLPLGLAAYNAGPQRVASVGGDISRLPAETQSYVRSIAGQQPQTQTAQATPPVIGQVRQMLQSDNPQVRGLGEQLAVGYLQQGLKSTKTNDITDYEYAKSQGFKGTLQDWVASKRAGAGEFGLQPIYGTGPDGKPVVLQLGKSGTAVQSKIPEGVSISTGVEKVDLGTQWGLLDKRSGQFVGYMPKDLKGAERDKAIGHAQGTVAAGLPTDIMNADQTVQQIDQLIKNPGVESIVGPVDQYRSGILLGDQGRDALARYNQLKGKAFLQAYSTLKGGGQITEVEGAKAENALARMDRSQNEADFKQALTDFRDAVTQGLAKLKERAGVAADPTQPAPAADSGGWQQIAPGIRIREKR